MSERYDYEGAVKQDCEEAIKDCIEGSRYTIDASGYENFESFKEDLYDQLFDNFQMDDSITGASSGSYTFNYWKAEENICHNLDLLREACEEFGSDYANMIISRGAETADSCIRQYLVPQVLQDAIDNCEEELKEYYDKENAKEEVELD
jgi:hypothetical protein